VPVPPASQPGEDITGYWPWRDFLELGALHSAVPCARLHARHILREWALTPLTDQTELVVSDSLNNQHDLEGSDVAAGQGTSASIQGQVGLVPTAAARRR
jgi:hypothetical protein